VYLSSGYSAAAASQSDAEATPGLFLIRLAADFAGRPEQLAAAFGLPQPKAAEDVMLALFTSVLETEMALQRGGGEVAAQIIYRCAMANSRGLARTILEKSLEATVAPGLQAKAWFAFALSSDLPPLAASVANEALDGIRNLYRTYPEAAVREPLAMALFNRSTDLGTAGQLEASGEAVEELRQLHASYPEAAVREQLAKALFNRSTALGTAGQLEASGEAVEELRQLHASYPEAAVREPLAMALFNRANRSIE
jgi:tetratricopeptide (TPR) repeat protein